MRFTEGNLNREAGLCTSISSSSSSSSSSTRQLTNVVILYVQGYAGAVDARLGVHTIKAFDVPHDPLQDVTEASVVSYQLPTNLVFFFLFISA